ncbi:DUF6919 domain-containing protein [Streptomyces mirabilis]|uniref:DUF6919 domain-containing protein n=1 Tax=Streptomyces mirabilis TaxID=68239 RepID=UPI0036A3CF6A
MSIRLPWMNRTDSKAWCSARTTSDLGQLTARWLEGDLASQPGYMPNHGPDPETEPLIPVLAAANRAGFVTNASQPGDDDHTHGTHWQQRAAVTGFITDTALLGNLTDRQRDTDLLAQLLDTVWVNCWSTSRKTFKPGDRPVIHHGEDSILTHLSEVLFVIAYALPTSAEGLQPSDSPWPIPYTDASPTPEISDISAQLQDAAQALDKTVGLQQIAPALQALADYRTGRRTAGTEHH